MEGEGAREGRQEGGNGVYARSIPLLTVIGSNNHVNRMGNGNAFRNFIEGVSSWCTLLSLLRDILGRIVYWLYWNIVINERRKAIFRRVEWFETSNAPYASSDFYGVFKLTIERIFFIQHLLVYHIRYFRGRICLDWKCDVVIWLEGKWMYSNTLRNYLNDNSENIVSRVKKIFSIKFFNSLNSTKFRINSIFRVFDIILIFFLQHLLILNRRNSRHKRKSISLDKLLMHFNRDSTKIPQYVALMHRLLQYYIATIKF